MTSRARRGAVPCGQRVGAAKLLARREAVIIGASRRKGFDWRVLQDALSKAADIH